MKDFLGNPIGRADERAQVAIDKFIAGFIGYTPSVLEPLSVADEGSQCPLVHIYAGWLWMFSEAPTGPQNAQRYVQNISVEKLPLRECWSLRALECWMAGDKEGATCSLERVLEVAPRDMAALKLHQYLNFNRGHCADMLRIALQALPAADDVPQLHGMLAFGYEQCHLLPEAERAARRALELLPEEPWAQHALAHVYLTQGRILEGLQFLESRTAHWEGLTSFMYTHNWWHLALFYLSEGRFEDALTVYDQHVWARDRHYSQDQVGAVSLLSRMELAGQNVGQRWAELGAYLADRRADVVEPFLTLQYLYGLARAGLPEARFLMEAIEGQVTTPSAATAAVWQQVALPTAQGLLAHARGDHVACVNVLGPALGRMLEVGGSHAQRDLFAQIYLDSLIKSGADSAAQQILEQRRFFEPDGVPLNRSLAEVYSRLGLPKQAATALGRATRQV